MSSPSILVSTWESGIFSVTATTVRHEVAAGSVRGMSAGGDGGALAIVDRHAIYRRSAYGVWAEIATSDYDLSCCVAVGDEIFAGTDDARILHVDRDGVQRDLTGFRAVEGRETWYAGTAIVDGSVVGPPLGIRSMTASCDGGVLLANVHVGGIPRSTDAGLTWRPTIEVDADVHEVAAHPARPALAIAASAAGLCTSRDGGTTWAIEREGLHAPHCSAVAFGRHDVFVSAATDPFAAEGAVYRRPLESEEPLQKLGGGMPEWTDGVVDTGCIAARDAMVALIDRAGWLYVSFDDGATWSTSGAPLPAPSALHIC